MSAQLQSVQSGYVADVAWPDHFHREQMPGWLHAVCAAVGVAAPSLERPFHWCDLGCGGGLSALVAAACFPHARFTAVDVDPAQIERAAATAHEAGLDNIRFVAADLRDFAMQADSADTFDSIVSHGVWAWVGEDVRQAIVDVARHRLAPGGVLQLGYMSHPGASQLQGVHKLMQEAARRVEGDSAARAQIARGRQPRSPGNHGDGHTGEPGQTGSRFRHSIGRPGRERTDREAGRTCRLWDICVRAISCLPARAAKHGRPQGP